MGDDISIHFMRHGRSRADDEGVHEGRYDSPLTDVGRAQAEARGMEWKALGVRFDRIISSTLVRAQETAKIIGNLLDLPVELAGLSIEEAEARYPKPAFRNPYEAFHGVGESETELHCRAALALESIIRRGTGSYLVVSHGGFLNAVMRNIVGAQPPINGIHGIWFAFGDTGYIRCGYAPKSHRWILREMVQGN